MARKIRGHCERRLYVGFVRFTSYQSYIVDCVYYASILCSMPDFVEI